MLDECTLAKLSIVCKAHIQSISREDALFILNTLYKHLQKPKAQAPWILVCTQYSTAMLFSTETDFNYAQQLILWIMDFF